MYYRGSEEGVGWKGCRQVKELAHVCILRRMRISVNQAVLVQDYYCSDIEQEGD